MATHQEARLQMREALTISFSEMFTYLNCSLKHKFQYVEKRPQERISLALPFGRAIHSAIERYYRSLKDNSVPADISIINDLFEETLVLDIENTEVPIIYKNEAQDTESAIALGKSLLETFYANIDHQDMQVIEVEVPLSATLYNDKGEQTDFKLTGVVDLILKDDHGNIVLVDQKTAKQSRTQDAVDDDLQMTSYSYLVAANGYIFPRAAINCRFDVLRKLKTPKFEQHHTLRTAEHRKRFSRIAIAVLAGIENRIHIPCKSWICSDCQYKNACDRW